MKTENDLYWFHLDRDTVITRKSIVSIYHDRTMKEWTFEYGTSHRVFPEKQGRELAARLGVKP